MWQVLAVAGSIGFVTAVGVHGVIGYCRREYGAAAIGDASGDGGVDVVLHGRGEHVLVQRKHWRERSVGVRPTQKLLGVVQARQATRGIVIGSGRFTPETVRFATWAPRIVLVDGPELVNLIRSVCHQPGRTGEPTYVPPPLPRASVAPAYPACGRRMVRRTARRGGQAGLQFWGCPSYPGCRGTQPI